MYRIYAILFFVSIKSLGQTYFFEDFNYPNFQTLDSLYQNESRSSIWTTIHAVKSVDINENGLIDPEEDFKNSAIVKDPFDENNTIIRFELNKIAPYFYSKYFCDSSTINNTISDEVLQNNFNTAKKLYCVDCSQSPLGIASPEYKTHMNRNEIAIYGPKRFLYKAKREHWFGVKMLIDENYEIDELNPGEIVTQFHGKGRKVTNPPIALVIDKDRFKIVNIKNNDGKGESYDAGPVVKNKWIEWKYRVSFSKKDKHGIVEVWRDEEKVMSLKGKNFFKNYPVYLKIGIYKWGWWKCDKELNNTSFKAVSFDKVWANDKDITQN